MSRPKAAREKESAMPTAKTGVTRTIDIDFLFIDLTTCTRCRGTDDNLGRALESVRSVLTATGANVNVRKVLVDSEELARAHRFVSSPTIRVDGRDVALSVKESRCGSCGEVAGQATDCRVWTYEGAEYTEAPEPLLVDAILRAAYGPAGAAAEPEPYTGVPENLTRFFEAKASKGDGPCCPSSGASACCAPVVAPELPSEAAGCGCATAS
jgi:hypothetical protein